MSQYNLNGFNRSPYNIKPEYNVSWLNCTGMETVTGTFGVGFDESLSVNAYERVNFTGTLTPVRYKTATGSERVTSTVIPSIEYWMIQSGEEDIVMSTLRPSIIVRPTVEPGESITGTASSGFDANIDLTGHETISADVFPQFIQWTPGEGYELVSSLVHAESVAETVCDLTVTLNPGSTIVIDATNYNVLIDGENAIWVQSGEWLDNLNRETMSINIQAASGNDGLAATILYTERYL